MTIFTDLKLHVKRVDVSFENSKKSFGTNASE